MTPNFTLFVVSLKTALDAVAAVSYSLERAWPLALVFAGFAVADAGIVWVSLKP